MPDSMSPESLHRTQVRHGETLSVLTQELGSIKSAIDELKTERAVRQERDRNLAERLERIEKSIEHQSDAAEDQTKRITNVGWWLATTFAGVFLVAIAQFILKGGLSVAN